MTLLTISDHDFITQIEKLTLDPAYFDHKGHMRLAWLYVTTETLDIAQQHYADVLSRYATNMIIKPTTKKPT